MPKHSAKTVGFQLAHHFKRTARMSIVADKVRANPLYQCIISPPLSAVVGERYPERYPVVSGYGCAMLREPPHFHGRCSDGRAGSASAQVTAVVMARECPRSTRRPGEGEGYCHPKASREIPQRLTWTLGQVLAFQKSQVATGCLFLDLFFPDTVISRPQSRR